MKIVPVRVAIGLEGDKHDLDTACLLFSTCTNLQIQRVHIPPNEKVVLFADELNAMTDEDEIYATGQRLLAYVNGILLLHDSGRAPLETQGIVHHRPQTAIGASLYIWASTGRFRISASSDNREPGNHRIKLCFSRGSLNMKQPLRY